MNIIELMQSVLQQFPKIGELCNEIHIDFTDEFATNYGLSSTGDKLLKSDILGNQTRQHTFVLYAVYQSYNDYDRLNNSGVLLELQMWLEEKTKNQSITVNVIDETWSGIVTKCTCSNAMIYAIPDENTNSAWQYQIQIAVEYKITNESEEL